MESRLVRLTGRGLAEAPGFRGELADIALEERNRAARGPFASIVGLRSPTSRAERSASPSSRARARAGSNPSPSPRRRFRSGPASRALSRSRFPPWRGKDPDSGLRLGGHRRDRAASPRGARMGGRDRRRDTRSPRHRARSQGLRYARGPLRETSGPWRCRMAGQIPLAGSGVRRSQFRGRRQLAPDHSLLAPGPRRLEGRRESGSTCSCRRRPSIRPPIPSASTRGACPSPSVTRSSREARRRPRDPAQRLRRAGRAIPTWASAYIPRGPSSRRRKLFRERYWVEGTGYAIPGNDPEGHEFALDNVDAELAAEGRARILAIARPEELTPAKSVDDVPAFERGRGVGRRGGRESLTALAERV